MFWDITFQNGPGSPSSENYGTSLVVARTGDACSFVTLNEDVDATRNNACLSHWYMEDGVRYYMECGAGANWYTDDDRAPGKWVGLLFNENQFLGDCYYTEGTEKAFQCPGQEHPNTLFITLVRCTVLS